MSDHCGYMLTIVLKWGCKAWCKQMGITNFSVYLIFKVVIIWRPKDYFIMSQCYINNMSIMFISHNNNQNQKGVLKLRILAVVGPVFF